MIQIRSQGQENFNVSRSRSKLEQDKNDLEFWRGLWSGKDSKWHYNFTHPQLLKHISWVTGQNLTAAPCTDPKILEENGKKTWFLPLTGKTRDVSYLLSQGFKVFGVEASKNAIEEMSVEQNLGLTYDEEEQMFTGLGGQIRIFNGDFFNGPLEKFRGIDFIWDRASFCGIDYPFREQYINAMKKILRKPDDSGWYDFQYLLEAWVYDKTKFGGPPRSADEDDIKEYFESWLNVKFLSSEEPPVKDHPQFFTTVGNIGQFNRYYYMTPKK